MLTPRQCATVLLLICALCLASCSAGVYRSLGVPTTQAEAYAREDQARVDLVIGQIRDTTWEVVSTALAALGAVLSGFLAVKLRRTASIADAVIDGVELAADPGVKKKVRQVAVARGAEGLLHARLASAGYSRSGGPGKGKNGVGGGNPPTTEA